MVIGCRQVALHRHAHLFQGSVYRARPVATLYYEGHTPIVQGSEPHGARFAHSRISDPRIKNRRSWQEENCQLRRVVCSDDQSRCRSRPYRARLSAPSRSSLRVIKPSPSASRLSNRLLNLSGASCLLILPSPSESNDMIRWTNLSASNSRGRPPCPCRPCPCRPCRGGPRRRGRSCSCRSLRGRSCSSRACRGRCCPCWRCPRRPCRPRGINSLRETLPSSFLSNLASADEAVAISSFDRDPSWSVSKTRIKFMPGPPGGCPIGEPPKSRPPKPRPPRPPGPRRPGPSGPRCP